MSIAFTESRKDKTAFVNAMLCADKAAPTDHSQSAVAAAAHVSKSFDALTDISPKAWKMASLMIFVAAAILRFYHLELKPLHHDEGVNGFFLARLLREGFYKYDPENYHGPTLYYFALIVAKVNMLLFGEAGFNAFAIRLVPALFGILTVWLILQLRRQIGSIGALCGALLVAISPGAVYISRYFIHESLFVFFTLALVVAAQRYFETARAAYLLLAAIVAALLFATKETAIITIGVLIVALALMSIYARALPATRGKARDDDNDGAGGAKDWSNTPLARFGDIRHLTLLLLCASTLFIAVHIIFYSSFFANYPQGVYDSLKTFAFWTKTGTKDHTKPLWTYLKWLIEEEAALLLLGTMGAIFALRNKRDRFAIFTALWTFGILVAYSLIPYKTPWLMLNAIVPLAIASGYAIDRFSRLSVKDSQWRAAIIVIVCAALMLGSFQTINLNFFHYDDNRYPYVYVHTRREFLLLVDSINAYAAKAGTGTQTTINVMSPDYWPLPWYLHEYKHVWYDGHAPRGEQIVIISEAQEMELRETLSEDYQRIAAYTLRPGIVLVLYTRR